MEKTKFAALLAVLLVIGVGNVAWARDGDPFLVGRANKARHTTRLTSIEPGLFVSSQSIGVIGTTTVDGYGLWGEAVAGGGGTGVQADAHDLTGVAVRATNDFPGGVGLLVQGRSVLAGSVTLQQRGVATVPAGSKAVTVPLPTYWIDSSMEAFALIQQHRMGVFVEAAVVNGAKSSLTIFLNERVSLDTPVAWFLLH